METLCIKTKLKKELIEEIRDWFKTLQKRMPEVLQTLENEGVFVESAFLDQQGNDLYLIYYVKAKSIARVNEVFSKSDLPIDHYHKQCWKKFCEGREVLEEVLDVHRFENLNL